MSYSWRRDVERHTMKVDLILDRLKGVQRNGVGWSARCPAHKDTHNSLSISTGDDGRVLINCHAGCSFDDVCAAIDFRQSDLFADNGRGKRNGNTKSQIVATYDYQDESGRLLYQVVRYYPKDFRQRRPNGKGGWFWSMQGVRRVLYRLPELLAADPDEKVYICEGEKDVDRLIGLGLVATCNVGGAGKWRDEYSDHLKERRVAIVRDNHLTGTNHARLVVKSLQGKAAEIKILEPPGLLDKGDVSDWLDALPEDADATDRLAGLVDRTPVWEPTTTLKIAPDSSLNNVIGTDETDELVLTEMRIAERLVDRHGDSLRYAYGLGWLSWVGTHWERDTGANVDVLAKETVRSIYGELGRIENAKARTQAFTQLRGFETYHKLNGVRSLAASDQRIRIEATNLNTDAWLFNTLTGTVDLRTGALRPHRPVDLISKVAPVRYDPDAKCDLWQRFLCRVMANDDALIGYLQKFCGLCLTGDISEQCFWLLYGSGQNGKSVFLDTVLSVLGDYASKAPPDLLLLRRGDAHPTELADLMGKRLVITSETAEGRRLNCSLMKELTGDETLRARFMRQDFFGFTRTHKTALVTNHKPRISDDTLSTWRRVRVVPFTVRIPDNEIDTSLAGKLRDEWPGILAWAVRGCLKWQADGLHEPEAIIEATDTYRAEEDVLQPFLDDKCVLRPGQTSRADIWRSYTEWSKDSHERHTLGRKGLYERLRAHGCVDVRFREGGVPVDGFDGIIVK